MASGIFAMASILDAQYGYGDCINKEERKGYLLFCGRTRKMTQYAAVATADIDPGSLLRWFLQSRTVRT